MAKQPALGPFRRLLRRATRRDVPKRPLPKAAGSPPDRAERTQRATMWATIVTVPIMLLGVVVAFVVGLPGLSPLCVRWKIAFCSIKPASEAKAATSSPSPSTVALSPRPAGTPSGTMPGTPPSGDPLVADVPRSFTTIPTPGSTSKRPTPPAGPRPSQTTDTRIPPPIEQGPGVRDLQTNEPEGIDLDYMGHRSAGDPTIDLTITTTAAHVDDGWRMVNLGPGDATYFTCADRTSGWTTTLAFPSLRVGDQICADDGVNRYALLTVRSVPGGTNSTFAFTGQSWKQTAR